MCGIVGYIGKKDCCDILLDGLSKLEYRGYDSAGIAIINNNNFIVCKTKGRVNELSSKLEPLNLHSHIGISHTRWATHGIPSDENSHPHLDYTKTIGVVHNGIIENYLELKNDLMKNGIVLLSQTDTEVIPNVIYRNYTGNLLEATIKATKKLKGSYAIAVINKNNDHEMVVAKRESPLVIGKGENEFFVASDIPALLKYTKDVYILDDNEFANITDLGIHFYNSNMQEIQKEITRIEWSLEAAEKGGYDDFMLKEIYEQPTSIKDTIYGRIDNKILSEINIDTQYINNINKISIIACGTAMHAGIIGKYIIEKLARITVEVEVASEYRYRNPIIDEKTLAIFVSQSGETADTLACLKLAKQNNAKTLAITNVLGSTISREADYVIYTHAGPEIAVASTKAYNTQLSVLYSLAINIAKEKGYNYDYLYNDLITLHLKVQETLEGLQNIEEIAKALYTKKDAFFLGRGIDYCVSLEGSLKLKEITYIHSEAYACGELKHGPIALIDDDTYAIVTITDKDLIEKSLSNVQEVKTRGGKIIMVTNQEIDIKYYDYLIKIPNINSLFSASLSVIPLQLLSYYVSKLKGIDVDKPRNLAKSVTVE